MKTTTFENAKVGDKVWSFRMGWGAVIEICKGVDFPIIVDFEAGVRDTFTYCGKSQYKDVHPELFHSEVKFEVPPKPLPDLKVDTKVLVWDVGPCKKQRRHFSHFDDGFIVCFPKGLTSFTVGIGEGNVRWGNFEVVGDE